MTVLLIVTGAGSALSIGGWGLMILRPALLPSRTRSDRPQSLEVGLWLGFATIVTSGWIGSLGQLAVDHGVARWPFMVMQAVLLLVGAALGFRAARRIKRWKATHGQPKVPPATSSDGTA